MSYSQSPIHVGRILDGDCGVVRPDRALGDQLHARGQGDPVIVVVQAHAAGKQADEFGVGHVQVVGLVENPVAGHGDHCLGHVELGVLWLAKTRSWVISTSVSSLHPDRIGRFRRGHNLLISLTDEFWRGTGLKGDFRGNPGADQSIAMLHGVIILGILKPKDRSVQLRFLVDKWVVCSARGGSISHCNKDFGEIGCTKGGFSGARRPEGRFQSLIWGMSVGEMESGRPDHDYGFVDNGFCEE